MLGDDSFREEIDKRAIEWFRRSMEGLPSDVTNDYLSFRRESRTDSLESRILRSADKLEALMWTREELKLGNEYVKEAGIMEDIVSKMKKLEVESLRQLIEPLAQDTKGTGR